MVPNPRFNPKSQLFQSRESSGKTEILSTHSEHQMLPQASHTNKIEPSHNCQDLDCKVAKMITKLKRMTRSGHAAPLVEI
jgi:hypothetical protein